MPSTHTSLHYHLIQEDHHRTRSFREELVAFLEKFGVIYDPRYLD